jgi:hypothetical protein
MAKKSKKKKGSDITAPQSSRSGHQSTSIDEAENGFVVSHSGDTGGPNGSYFNKKYVAESKPKALQIASTCMAGGSLKKGGKGKKGGGKSSGRKAYGGKVG